MNPIVFQIIPCLFIASLIGFVIGWLLRRTDLRQLRDEIHIQNSHKNKLESELTSVRSDLVSAQQKKEQLHLNSLKLTDQLREHENNLSEVQEKMAQSHQLLSHKETALEALTSEHALNLQTTQKLQENLVKVEQHATEKQQEIDQWKKSSHQIQTELEQQKKASAQLRQSIESEFKTQLNEHVSNMEGLRNEHGKAIQQLQTEHQRIAQKTKEAHNEELKYEKLKAQSDLSSLQAEYARFQHEQQTLSKQRLSELHQVQQQLEDQSKKLLAAQENNTHTVAQLKTLHAQQMAQNEATFKSKTEALEKHHAQTLQSAMQRHEQAQQQLRKQIQEQVITLKNEQAQAQAIAQQLKDSQTKQSGLMSRVQELGQRMSGLATEHEYTQNLFNALKTGLN